MGVEEYWLGKNLDLEELWRDFDEGIDYIEKVESKELHLLRLTFSNHPVHLPLFDHEVIYKTVKGTFHDLKAECFSPDEYKTLTPIFLYRIDRGSGIYEFLGQFSPVMTLVIALGGTSMWYRSALTRDQEFDEKKLKFILTNFPQASSKDILVYMKTWTTFGRRRALYRFIEQGLYKIEVSRDPLDQKKPEKPLKIVNVGKLIKGGDT